MNAADAAFFALSDVIDAVGGPSLSLLLTLRSPSNSPRRHIPFSVVNRRYTHTPIHSRTSTHTAPSNRPPPPLFTRPHTFEAKRGRHIESTSMLRLATLNRRATTTTSCLATTAVLRQRGGDKSSASMATTSTTSSRNSGGVFSTCERAIARIFGECGGAVNAVVEAKQQRRMTAFHNPRRSQPGPAPTLDRDEACPRSALFIPASKPRALQKIYTLHADCYILDLEDSVGLSAKREARENLGQFVKEMVEKAVEATDSGEAGEAAARKHLVVRINSPDADLMSAVLDLELVGQLGTAIHGVVIPKVTPASYGIIEDYVHPYRHCLWAQFETPQSIVDAHIICQSKRFTYAVMGYNDLANELQLPASSTIGNIHSNAAMRVTAAAPGSTDVPSWLRRLPLYHCATQIILAARAAGMHVLDGVYNDPTDTAGFLEDLQACRALGFNGKTLIHPSQIAPTHEAYCPTEAEVQWATRIQQAVAHAGGGVAICDGKMVEMLHVRQAARVLALHSATALEAEAAAHAAASLEKEPKSTLSRKATLSS